MSNRQHQSNKYEEIATLRDPDGVVCVITKKVGSDFFSFSFVKEFERDGERVRTGFFSRRHVEGLRRMVDQVEEWVDREIDRARAARAAQ